MNWEKLLAIDQYGTNDVSRSPFDRDFDRIIFSHPFRRLQDKTQVHPLPEHDFVHNRLTHSLEVSSVGRSLGRAVGENVLKRNEQLAKRISAHDFGTIVASAALAHDIGNPPFGHSGESSISDYFVNNKEMLREHFNAHQWADLINFEGNAQGLRLINRSGNDGLKLTKPTIASFIKYPKPALAAKVFKERKSQKKYGYFFSEEKRFKELVEALGISGISENQFLRHPLAFLVEAADDICYNVIDLEDGCNLGLVSYEETVALYGRILKEKFKPEKLNKIPLQKERIGLLRALSISVLVEQCVEGFLKNEEGLLSGTYDKALADQIEASSVLEEIKMLSIHKIYRSRKVIEIEAAGYRVLTGLLEVFVPAIVSQYEGNKTYRNQLAIRLLPSDVSQLLRDEDTLYGQIRVLLDFVSGMTDSYAVNLHRRINGTSLPGIN